MENLIGKIAKVFVGEERYLSYTFQNDYTQQFLGFNSKRRKKGKIIEQCLINTKPQTKCNADYKYSVQFEDGYTIRDLKWRQIEIE